MPCNAAVWLASDESGYIVGSTLFVDGGMNLFPGFATGGLRRHFSRGRGMHWQRLSTQLYRRSRVLTARRSSIAR